MDANGRKYKIDDLAKTVVGAAYKVSNTLGAGFLEKVYERSLARELILSGFDVESQVEYSVDYRGQAVGRYVADLVVEDMIVVEVKCVESFANEHIAQCINYLKASHLKLALLINFQTPKVQWKRIVLNK